VSAALVVHCHPDPESLSAAARDRALAALRTSGHEVSVVDLYADGFDPLEPTVDTDAVAQATILVLTYPTWYGGQPAALSAWLDRVLATPGALRTVRRIVVVTSHGAGRFTNRLEGEPGRRVARRALRAQCHKLARSRWIALYGVDRDRSADRERWLTRIDRELART
jgi:putative NADPH-quinone reductase